MADTDWQQIAMFPALTGLGLCGGDTGFGMWTGGAWTLYYVAIILFAWKMVDLVRERIPHHGV